MSAAPLLSFGLVEDRPVFMDEASDSYLLLEQEQEQEFLDGRARPTMHFSRELREALGADPRQVGCARCDRPTSAILGSAPPAGRFAVRDLAQIACLLARTRNDIRRRPIASLLAALRPSEASAAPAGDMAAVRAATLPFLAARRLLPVRHSCLLDSIALVRWLAARGLPATLVFGVKLHPFAAHCWVQSGTLLLNDRLETVHRFAPVRVLPCAPVTP